MSIVLILFAFHSFILLLSLTLILLFHNMMDSLYKNFVLIRNAISAMVFASLTRRKSRSERIDVTLEKYSLRSVKYFWRIRRVEYRYFSKWDRFKFKQSFGKHAESRDWQEREEDTRTWFRLFVSFCENELLLLPLFLLLLFLLSSFTYHFYLAPFFPGLCISLSDSSGVVSHQMEAGEMVDLATNLNKYGRTSVERRRGQRLARHRLEMRE